MRRHLIALTASAMLAIALVPGTSRAEHCPDLFIFSAAMTLPDNPASSGMLNPGCVVDNEAVNTNFLMPGATVLRVGATKNGTLVPTEGKAKFEPGNQEVELNFSLQTTTTGATRWITQTVQIPAGSTSVTASAKVANLELVRVPNSVTYTSIA